MKTSEYKIGLAAFLLFVFLSGILLGWVIHSTWERTEEAGSQKVEVHEGQYDFINPLLECGDTGSFISKELQPFRDSLSDLIEEIEKDGKVKSVSVYFRDLNNGPWFGIKERETFIPASLLKVPIMMAYLNEAESNPRILGKKIKYDGDQYDYNELEYVKPSVAAEYGRQYTVEELLYMMVVYSDNNSTLLLSNTGWSIIKNLYATLGFPPPNLVTEDYTISVQNYATFFRILFNASYLNKDMSNKALDMLASVDFRRGLASGVPVNVKVAHKFGERRGDKGNQFHDCGIVYYPGHPYLLCVMTSGGDSEDLISAIEDVSRMTYEEVDRQRRR